MVRFAADRAPLEATAPSKRQKIVVCPYCLTGRSVSLNWYSCICVCKKYFSVNNSLDKEKAKYLLNTNTTINKEFTKLKAKTEKQAYEYKEKVMDKRKSGKVVSHEPGGVERRW